MISDTSRLPIAQPAARRGFTLVELLVVVAIIGLLVALLLPAVQASREAGRRTHCKNQLKQIGLAILNHVDSVGVFPTGGNTAWPEIEDYVRNGTPYGPARQGLGWAYQILPYLEAGPVHSIVTTEQLAATPISLYFCPSRRGPTANTTADGPNAIPGVRWLIDYAGANPVDLASLSHLPDFVVEQSVWLGEDRFWGRNEGIWTVWPGLRFDGVIVRTDYNPPDAQYGAVGPQGNPRPIGVEKVTDGLSKTLVIGEKRLHPDDYSGGAWHDDRGWSDGWDPDQMRGTNFPIRPDQEDSELTDWQYGFCFGSAHPGGVNFVFADGSVRVVEYDLPWKTLNRLAHRSDGE